MIGARRTICRAGAVAADTRGAALIEFAFVLPFLLLLYLGGYQLTDGLTAYRKVTITTRTIADLTAQYSTVTDTDLHSVLNASQQVMSPYSPANARLTISQIKVDGSGNSTVDWSCGKNTNGLVAGTAFSLPAEIKQNNTSVIIAETNYDYVPTVAPTLIGSITMRDRMVMRPRTTDSISGSVSSNCT